MPRLAYQCGTDYDATAAAAGFASRGWRIEHIDIDYSEPPIPVASRPIFGGGVHLLGPLFHGRDRVEDYPACLRPFMGRNVWASTLGEAIEAARRTPIFVKSQAAKVIPGVVITRALLRTNWAYTICHRGEECPVWCSDVVPFRNEWRVVAIDGKVVGWTPIPPRCSTWEAPSESTARHIAAELHAAYPHQRATSFDVGLTRDGRTLLVEQNGPLAFGRYGIDPVTYSRVIEIGWRVAALARRANLTGE